MYKNVWSPYVGEVLLANLDDRPEALEYDKFAVGIYNENEEGEKELVGHVPVELESDLPFSKRKLGEQVDRRSNREEKT